MAESEGFDTSTACAVSPAATLPFKHRRCALTEEHHPYSRR